MIIVFITCFFVFTNFLFSFLVVLHKFLGRILAVTYLLTLLFTLFKLINLILLLLYTIIYMIIDIVTIFFVNAKYTITPLFFMIILLQGGKNGFC